MLVKAIIFVLSFVLVGSKPIWSNKNGAYAISIEKGIEYAQIVPFADEWRAFWDQKHLIELSTIQLWFRCIEREVRGYLFIEDLHDYSHGKEAYLRNARYIRQNLKMTANDQPVLLRAWNGGGDFFFNITDSMITEDDLIDIRIEGFKHYTRFRPSTCTSRPPVSKTRKYIMHIHLKEYNRTERYEPAIIDGIAHHMAYHRCALNLFKYEVVIQEKHLKLYLQNSKIAHAVKQGWITFLIRSPVWPTPIISNDPIVAGSCYYQAYTQNMAILQHWKENVKIFFWDSDEYLSIGDGVTSTQLTQLIEHHSHVGFSRRLAFCDSCPVGVPESKHWSLTKSTLTLNDHHLRDPKLVVDPNRVGCFIVHWAGCGDKMSLIPLEQAKILHMENMYHLRWDKTRRPQFGNETTIVPTPMMLKCDPVNYDWKGPLPSFHGQH